MAGVLGHICVWVLICIHVTPLVLAQGGTQFVHYDFRKADLYRDGMATIEDGVLQITGNTTKSTGHAFHKTPHEVHNFVFKFVFIFNRVYLCNPSTAQPHFFWSRYGYCGSSYHRPQV
uniref:Legume lectin domain-containing protein n=1 Tax=Brassica oleracea TaxID=3712 RepID=A0A3P6E038_BRAOL|nr:unnamed protein product [Brassica oleracea]